MGTTDPSLIEPVLTSLGGVSRFAVLHGEGSVAAGATESDVDVVVDQPVPVVLARLLTDLASQRIYLVSLWNYDIGAWTTFWTRSPFDGGFQLDLTYDPRGLGRYGVRTDALVDLSYGGVKFPQVSETARDAYLIRKRLWKGDWGAVRSLIQTYPDSAAWRDLSTYWAPHAQLPRETVESAVSAELLPARFWRLAQASRTADMARRLERVKSRTGVLVAVEPRDLSIAITELDPLRSFMPRKVRVVDGENPLAIALELRRATLLVTSARMRWLSVDASVSDLRAGADGISAVAHEVLRQRLSRLSKKTSMLARY